MSDKMKLCVVETIALATAVKDKDFNDARNGIVEGSSQQVDFKVRITGCVQRSTGTPGAAYSVPASVQLIALPVFCAVLAHCGIGIDRLRRALESVDVSSVKPDDKRAKVFDEVAKAVSKSLPPVSGTSPRKSGVLQTTIAVELLK
jgi:hypothetical protein